MAPTYYGLFGTTLERTVLHARTCNRSARQFRPTLRAIRPSQLNTLAAVGARRKQRGAAMRAECKSRPHDLRAARARFEWRVTQYEVQDDADRVRDEYGE